MVNEKLVHMNLTNYGRDVKLIDIEYQNIYRMPYKRLKNQYNLEYIIELTRFVPDV